MSDTDQYQALATALATIDADKGAGEAHGMLCGMLATPGEAEQARWIAEVLANTEPKGAAARECLELMTTIFEQTRGTFGDEAMSFTPLLPGDDAPLPERAAALGAWCEGFVFGLGLGGLKDRSELQGEASEVVNDFGEIARVDTETDGDDEGEAAYTELVEYVRTGALLVQENLAAPSRGAPAGMESASGAPGDVNGSQ